MDALTDHGPRSLAARRPDVALLWDHAANHPLAPAHVTAATNRVVRWRCPASPDHAWPQAVVTRRSSPGCPFCSNKRVSVTNSLAGQRPDLAAEWHPELNGPLTPADIMCGAGKTVWWQCPIAGHAWEGTPNQRTHPVFQKSCPDCARDREAISGIRRAGPGGARSLVEMWPEQATWWHPTRNGERTAANTSACSKEIFWWRCPKGHEFEGMPVTRARSVSGCEVCAGHRAAPDSNLAVLAPELAAQWHPTLNGHLTPADVPAGSGSDYWWKCPGGPDHVWQAQVFHRRKNFDIAASRGCGFCARKYWSVTNNLAAERPDLALDWHPRNPLAAEQQIAGGKTRAWWLCHVCKREWQTSLDKRTRSDQGCKQCVDFQVSREETYLAHELSVFLPVDLARTRVRDAAGKSRSVDITVPSLRLAIEYDGWWHRDGRESDLAKTAWLAAAGWTVLRVREGSLGPLDDVWCVASDPARFAQTAATVLRALADAGYVSSDDADAYARAGSLLRADAARAAIAARAEAKQARQAARAARARR